MDKKGESIISVLLVGMLSLFFVIIIFAAFTPAHDKVRDIMNSTFTGKEVTSANRVNTAFGLSFIVLAFSVIVLVFLSALTRQSREYYR